MSISLFDLHCDTAFALLGHDFAQKLPLNTNKLHIDLDRASKFDAYVQCFSCYTTPLEDLPPNVTPIDVFNLEYSGIKQQIELNSNLIRLAGSASDIRRNVANGVMSAVLTLEGTAGIGYDASALETLYKDGFRFVSLGWNEKNCLTGSHCTGGGLTECGREFVREAQRLGYIIDVSHISDEGFWDLVDISCSPIVATHSNSRALCGNSRNLTDDMFLAICQSGGVAGVNLYRDFLGEHATLDTVCDHIMHFLELDPNGNHISIGGDLDGCDKLPHNFEGIQSYPLLAARLRQRGLDDNLISNIFWNNALGVFDRCCM